MAFFALLAFALFSCVPAYSQAIEIPPVKTSIDAGGQAIAITARATLIPEGQSVKLKVSADLSDFQDHITDLLRAQLNRSDRCGERLSVDRAAIQPASPAAALTATVHYEKWMCAKALGQRINKRLVGGNATVPLQLTPVLSDSRELKLTGEVGRIQADGSLGDVLRSGSFGDSLQEKIRASILAALNKSTGAGLALPSSVAAVAKIGRAAFVDSGQGRLGFEVTGEIAVPLDQVRALLPPRQ